MKHREDDERHEAGEPMPDHGNKVDPKDVGARPNPFAECWTTITDEWFSQEPPHRDFLLRRPLDGQEDEEDEHNPKSAGYLPAGEVGLLVSAGGVGKSMALLLLAIAIATGTKWLNYFNAVITGKVLVALGEEDIAEARRRIYAATRVIWTDACERAAMEAMIKERVVLLPLKGKPVAIVSTDRRTGIVEEQPALEQLRELVRERGPFRLIGLDPLSRFAGPDTETDNAAATRFVQALESLTQTPGHPTIMLAHHSTKAGRSAEAGADVSNSRGSSALTDGARWVSELRRGPTPNTVTLEMTKTNYTSWAPQKTLIRERRGVLRVTTTPERIDAAVNAPPAKKNGKSRGVAQAELQGVSIMRGRRP